MTLSLDTSQIVDLLRGREEAAARVFGTQLIRRTPMIVSAPVRFALVSGVRLSATSQRRATQLSDLLAQFDSAPFTNEDAEAAGVVDADLRRRGRPIGDIDTLIAGQALARGWAVVTRNVRHFGRVEGLSLIDWSVGPDPLDLATVAARVAEGL